MGPYVHRYLATDQDYALKLLKQNIVENTHNSSKPSHKATGRGRDPPKRLSNKVLSPDTGNIQVVSLDWELNSVSALPGLLREDNHNISASEDEGVDAVIACDCIYNDSLIEPFVRTCVEVCQLRKGISARKPTLCIIAQQLRSPEVFEAWLVAFCKAFQVWRIPESLLTGGLKQDSGFVVHIGRLRN